MRSLKVFLSVCLFSALSLSALAQNFSGDARAIAMGGMGSGSNEASRFAGASRPYTSFVVPLGLFQVLRNRDIYDPGTDDFNPIRAMESIASPMHVTFSRKEGDSAELLVRNIVEGGLSRDLNTYRGFIPKPSLTAKGLVSPNWGKTFTVRGGKDSPRYHGVYVGAGPYLSIGTNLSIDQNLIDVLASSTDVYRPNTSFLVHNTTDGQAAAAITVGYRTRLPMPGKAASGRDGVYISANYNHLHGLHYDTAKLDVRFDTDAAGLVTMAPTTTPVVATHEWSQRGSGFAVDLATDIVVDRWDIRFAASGIGNHIEWRDLHAKQYVLTSLLENLDFTQTPVPAPAGTRRIELPIQYSGGGSYNGDRWTFDSEIIRGLQKTEVRAGGEYRQSFYELRAGARFIRNQWQPAGGIGLNISRRVGVDVAIFGTATNIEKVRKATMAVSLRFQHQEQESPN